MIHELKNFKKYIKSIKKYNVDMQKYIKENNYGGEFEYSKRYKIPMLWDWYDTAGNGVDEHYFLQDIYVAKKICREGIKEHYDIGSRINGFIAHLLAAGIEVNLIDIREAPFFQYIEEIHFTCADATNLEGIKDESIESMSSLHAIEHFGLGRYGDFVDGLAWKKVLTAMKKKLAKGGMLYISVPVGKEERCCFNAHRVFSPLTIIKAVCDETICIKEFTFIQNMKINTFDFGEKSINDTMRIIKNLQKDLMEYDCGIFIFKKIC